MNPGAEAGESDLRSGIHSPESRHDHFLVNFLAVVAAVFGNLEEKRRHRLGIRTRQLTSVADETIDQCIGFIPIHLQPPAASLGYGPGSFPVAESQVGRILSLPVHPYLTEADIEYVAELINAYYA